MIALMLAAGIALSCDVLPGFVQEGPKRLYEGENLFEYMNGNSEGYLVYGFVRMHGITCAKGAQKILIDISEMKDHESAHGMFTSNRDLKNPVEAIGTAGQVVPRKAIFSKGVYFVEVAAEAQGDHSAVLRGAAKQLEAKLSGSTELPPEVRWFPAEGLTAGPPRLVPVSVLGVRVLKRGYMAQYGAAKAFVVTEESPDAAREVMKKWLSRFETSKPAAAKPAEEAFEVTDQYLGRIVVARRGSRLVGCASDPAKGDPAAITNAVLQLVPK